MATIVLSEARGLLETLESRVLKRLASGGSTPSLATMLALLVSVGLALATGTPKDARWPFERERETGWAALGMASGHVKRSCSRPTSLAFVLDLSTVQLTKQSDPPSLTYMEQ